LRDEVMGVAQGALRGGGVGHGRGEVEEPVVEPVEMSSRERRQALMERSFIFEGTFGDNPKLLEALEIAEKAAPTDLPVLIDGESGTGKELMAKVIHANGCAPTSRSSRSTAARFRTACSNRNCSATRRARSPARPTTGAASSRARTPAPSSSTRSASCR
jgi:hypothetical protein